MLVQFYLPVCPHRKIKYIFRLVFVNRCEAGQELVRQARVQKIIALCRTQFPGDFDIQRQTRRLELALKDDGWRGNVEAIIDQEYYGIDSSKMNANLSIILGGISSTLAGSSMGSRKASRARGSTGSRQKRVSKNEKDALNNLDFLDADFADGMNETNDSYHEGTGLGHIGESSLVSEFTEVL